MFLSGSRYAVLNIASSLGLHQSRLGRTGRWRSHAQVAVPAGTNRQAQTTYSITMANHPSHGPARPGQLFYVVGPSGAGKDTILADARAKLAGRVFVALAHRYITRPADGGNENHIALSSAEFALRDRAGLFAMQWDSNGHRYGIGLEIHQWLDAGVSVLVNGSRGYLSEALRFFPDLRLVLITASVATLHQRLAARGREDQAAIAARLERALAFGDLARDPELQIVNDGSTDEAGDQLVSFIEQCLSYPADRADRRTRYATVR